LRIGDHIPGNPTVIVQNMTGGGGAIPTNYLYKVALKVRAETWALRRDGQGQVLQSSSGERSDFYFDLLAFVFVHSPQGPSDSTAQLFARDRGRRRAARAQLGLGDLRMEAAIYAAVDDAARIFWVTIQRTSTIGYQFRLLHRGWWVGSQPWNQDLPGGSSHRARLCI
jgi:hypothetical protein